jgi:dipeptidyl aminopeptidase/acylaminoacyl peptidase
MKTNPWNRCQRWFVLAGLAATILPSPGRAQDSLRPLVPNDYNRLRGIQDIQASPDGKQVLLQIGVVDSTKDEYTADLWLLVPSTGTLRQLTFGEGIEHNARFSPDGRRIAFIASRGDHAQVHVLPLEGGETTTLFAYDGDIDEFEWFPDGSRIAFIAKDPEAEDSARAREQVITYTRTYYKVNGSGFLDNRHTHLWVIDLASGATRRIGGGPYDFAAPSVSPDGRFIAFVSNRTADRDENRNSDIFVIPSDSGALIQVSLEPGAADQPRWSPDGRALAYLEQVVPNNYGAHSYLWVSPVLPGPRFGPGTNLTLDLDRHVAPGSYTEGGSPYPRWSRDSRTIYVAIEDRARVHGYAIDASSGARRLLLGGDRMVEFVTPVEGGLIFGQTDATHLSDVYLSSLTGANLRQMTTLNDSWFRGVRVLPRERITFRSPDGTEVEGFVVKPAGFQAGRRYPTILGIHGGPQWYYPAAYHMQFQIAAGRGYLAVYINPRGSTTYGRRFMDLVGGRYAHADDQDFMTALDTVVARGWADPANLFLMGNSYGGIATNWLITQTSRFKAAASSSGVADYTASFGVDDDHIEWLADMGGAPWEVPERYRAQSPMTHIARVSTPTIFLHGAEDHICPVGESERMYLALKLRGVETRLAIFPGENHNFDAKASSYPLRTRLILDWFDEHRH